MSSKLIVEVCEIKEIIEHENADALELAVIKGWQCVTRKGQYVPGDKVIFIPPDAVLPIELADNLGVRNYLSGKNKDRVKCVRLRGEMSFGLIINVPEGKDWEVGYDCVDDLGITKYIPPVRATSGDAAPSDPFFIKYTDIENIRNFPDIFEEGEMVVATEKIDGTNDRISASIDEEGNVEWKAGSHKVKRKMPNEEDIASNIYWYPFTLPSVKEMLIDIKDNALYGFEHSVTIYGEVYGRVRGGHKSLHYGKPLVLAYVAFDIMIDNVYVDYDIFDEICKKYNIPTVPVVAIMPFSFDKFKELSKGNSILAKENNVEHMREGIVIKALKERRDPKMGRAILKMLNDDYLILKNKAYEKGEITDFTDE